MHRFNGYDIELTRGNTLFFKIDLTGRALPEGSVAYFTVKSNPKAEETVIYKKLDASDGVLDIKLYSEDTDLPVRTYYWDVCVLIPLEAGGYEVETPMEYASFTIVDAISDPGDAGQPPGTDADLPVLSLLIKETRELNQETRKLIEALKKIEISPEQIAEAVDAYLRENPVEVTAVTINGEGPDEHGNFVLNVLNDAEIADLSAVLI